MNYNKVKSFCSKFRMAIGIALIATGVITGNAWFYLGVIPLIAGFTKFCPLCMITQQCDVPENKKKEETKNESN
jgi:phosphoglycerol transferase MdoB-like AlkP superfamily enzyme